MYTHGIRINAKLVKEGSFRINAKLVKEGSFRINAKLVKEELIRISKIILITRNRDCNHKI